MTNSPNARREAEEDDSGQASAQTQPDQDSVPEPAAAPGQDPSAPPEPPGAGSGEAPAAGPTRADTAGRPVQTPGAASAEKGGAVRRFFWMDERLAKARREGFGAGQPGWDDFKQGREAIRAAEQLSETDEPEIGALFLWRAAVALLARARLARAGQTPSPAPIASEHWGRLAELFRGEQAGAAGASSTLDDFELGREAVRTAEKLCEPGGAEGGARLLYRTAALFFVRAHLAQPDGALGPATLSEQDWERLSKLPQLSGLLGALSDDERRLLTVSASLDGESHLARLSADERRTATRLLGRVARVLAAPLETEARRVARVLLLRWVKIGSFAAAVIALVALVVLQSVSFEEHNLALHRPVVMSSVYSLGNVGHDPALLVDGDTQNLGFHTDRGGPQHVTIDLGAVQSIDRVVVYNRTDCCREKAVPLRVEVSEDGKRYKTVATHKKNFEVWEAEFSSEDARYVRLTSLRGDYFHLAEVEVY